MPDHLEELFAKIRAAYATLRNTCQREQFEAHLRSLAEDDSSIPGEVPIPEFPEEIHVAYATCACGTREFIVDGSTQECQNCGGLMFRHETRAYSRGGG